jgi:mevalonate kinase
LIGDTGQRALTKVAVGDVRRLYELDGSRVPSVLDSIGGVVLQARRALEDGDVVAVGRLMTENHAHLKQLTVSSNELDVLVQAALDAGALGAKLSGGGRGGSMIALLQGSDQSDKVRNALLKAGALRVFETVVR